MFAEYKVINIINEFALIIDYGTLDGAKVGDDVRIYTKGEEIFDLNKSSLGHIEMIKDELEIVEVFDELLYLQKKLLLNKEMLFNQFNLLKQLKLNKNWKLIKLHYHTINTMINLILLLEILWKF